MTTTKLFAMCAAASLLTACGAEKKDAPPIVVAYGGPTTTAAVTPSQVGPIASSVFDSVNGISGSATGAAGLTGALSGGASPTVKDALKLAAKYRPRGGTTLAGVAVSATEPCDGGGSVTVAGVDADGLATTTDNGDYVQASFAACNPEPGGAFVINGSLMVEILNTDHANFLDDAGEMTDGFPYEVKVTYGQLVFVFAGLFWGGTDGDIAFTWSIDQTLFELAWAISGNSIVTAAGDVETGDVLAASKLTGPGGVGQYSDAYVEEFADVITSVSTPSASRWAFDGRVCALRMNGCLDVITGTEFWKDAVDHSRRPDRSRSRTAPLRSSSTATSGTGNVTVTYDLDIAHDPPNPVTVYTTWDCLDTPGGCPAL